eukprot:c21470_g1_i1 orf=350-1030(-)
MDGDLWAARLSAAKRRHSLQHSQHHLGDNNDDFEGDDDMRSEFSCPYCYEDYDISTLCYHLEDEHLYEYQVVVCPVCTAKVGKDMVGHITRRHAHLFKMQRHRRLKRVGVSSGASLSLFGKELKESHLQALLGGVAFRGSNVSSSSTADSLLSALMHNFPISKCEDPALTSSCGGENLRKSLSSTQQPRVSSEVPLSAEEREQKMKHAMLRAKFVQQLVISTLRDS